jgi:antitoxin ParD1/3/4
MAYDGMNGGPAQQQSLVRPVRFPVSPVNTMKISLPDTLKSFVDEQVAQHGYGTRSEYVRELIRQDADRLRLRGLLLDGAASGQAAPADAAYFEALRERVQRRKPE